MKIAAYEMKNNLVNIDGKDMDIFRDKKRFSVFILESFDVEKLKKQLKGATSLLVCMQISKKTTLKTCKEIIEDISTSADLDAIIIWGAQVGKENKLLVMAGW